MSLILFVLHDPEKLREVLAARWVATSLSRSRVCGTM